VAIREFKSDTVTRPSRDWIAEWTETLRRGQDLAEQHKETAGQATEEPDATAPAKQKAAELEVDLSQVEGSGANGRITVKDVTRAAH
jgi:pyruvate/2-oxoglutarate dehydrogenase complex dihydrolipoamide acyltransferase (E2) component